MQVEKLPLDQLKTSEITRQTIANLGLEGMHVSDDMLLDLQLLDCGKITKNEFLKRGFTRAKKINHGFVKQLPQNRRSKFRSDDDLWKKG